MLGGYGVGWLPTVISMLHTFRLSMMHKVIEHTRGFSPSVYTCHMIFFSPLPLHKQPIASIDRVLLRVCATQPFASFINIA